MPEGTVFSGSGPLKNVTLDLRRIAVFLQDLLLFSNARLVRYEDWWEHEGLHFKKGHMDLHDLFVMVDTPRHLFESMPGDDHVFIGLGPEDESWYLRFYADWDCANEGIDAAYALALTENYAQLFMQHVLPELSSCTETISSGAYYNRISDGACTL